MCPKNTQERFRDPNLSEASIHSAVEEYLKAIEVKKMDYWSTHVYATSKMMLNAWSRFVLQ